MLALIYTTLDDKQKAISIIESLISLRLVACANIFISTSVYRWEGKVQQAEEFSVLIKTTQENLAKTKEIILALHPYEIPCVIDFEANSVPPFLDWVTRECTQGF
ncbi:MAG: divalent-cation tolerance protein CutA [Saprospiraceae bacterium]|jgi:periplasmic divalent cation tolerance protein|nr:divalent-cation tolerance protein CutA [Saprospiraceae bacterium]